MDNHNLKDRFMARPVAEMLSEDQVLESFVDVGLILQFWRQWYLHGFVDCGVGKVKFIRGKSGSGKTHLLREMHLTAKMNEFLSVFVDARQTRLMAIDELYRAVAGRVPWEDIIEGCARRVIHERLGYRDFALPVQAFFRWAQDTHGRSSNILATDVRDETDKWIRQLDISPSWMDPIRSLVRRRITGDSGYDELVYRWLCGERLSVGERRNIGVSSNIDRRNARSMLVSLAVLTQASSYQGLMVLVDNAEVMASTMRTEGVPYYTRGSRDQAYEMLRELIDESHHSPYLFMVVAGNSALYEDQKTGFPSYPALWARIHSEIATLQINRFADLVELDGLWRQHREDHDRLLETWRAIGHEVQLEESLQDGLETLSSTEPESVRRTVVRALAESLGGVNHGV